MAMLDSPIEVVRCDYDCATRVMFDFGDLHIGFQFPDDATKEEIVSCLEFCLFKFEDETRGSFFYMPHRYRQLRRGWARQAENHENLKDYMREHLFVAGI